MGSEFTDTTSHDSGAALQTAWFGGPAAGHLVTRTTSRRHMTITSCMAEVASGAIRRGSALKLGELHMATGTSALPSGRCW